MKFLILLFSLFLLSSGTPPGTFRESQLKHTRVREAFANKGKAVIKALTDIGISRDSLVREFPICEISGEIGPKRRSQDLQVPEGFYRINELNPYSKYYLSMKINYPNASDSIRGVKGRLGNLIYIHGGCESSGCIAINDDRMKELYVYCIEAYNAGQKEINIAIYPARLDDKNKDKVSLWADLKKSYDLFNLKKIPPTVKFNVDGTHQINISPEMETQSAGSVTPVAIQGPTLNQ